jgi:AcrR family transcriptional regulator
MSVNSHPGERAEPRKRPAQLRSRRTVDAILDAAARIYGERGYAATTTNHVAEEAGVSIGSLYQYFPNKDSLLVALEERHLAQARQRLSEAAREWRDTQPQPADWARSFVSVLVEVNDSPLHLLIYDTAPPLPHLQQTAEEVVGELAAELVHHLRRWGHRGALDSRAVVMVAAAIRLVHDLAIRQAGRQRADTCEEIVRMLTAAITVI